MVLQWRFLEMKSCQTGKKTLNVEVILISDFMNSEISLNSDFMNSEISLNSEFMNSEIRMSSTFGIFWLSWHAARIPGFNSKNLYCLLPIYLCRRKEKGKLFFSFATANCVEKRASHTWSKEDFALRSRDPSAAIFCRIFSRGSFKENQSCVKKVYSTNVVH